MRYLALGEGVHHPQRMPLHSVKGVGVRHRIGERDASHRVDEFFDDAGEAARRPGRSDGTSLLAPPGGHLRERIGLRDSVVAHNVQVGGEGDSGLAVEARAQLRRTISRAQCPRSFIEQLHRPSAPL